MVAPRGSIVSALAPSSVWYHGTSEAGAAQIRRDGFIQPTAGMGRATGEAHVFLTRDPAEAAKYGPVVIPVHESGIPVTPGSRPLAQRGDVIAISSRVPVQNARPVADRQTLTMAASQHPLWTGSNPLSFKPGDKFTYLGTKGTGQGFVGADGKPRNEDGQILYGPGNEYDLGSLKDALKAKLGSGDYEYTGPLPANAPDFPPANSQAIGDRPVTTMTNPLPAYNPLTMVKGQAAAQLRTLINHALAQRGLSPLINAPLPVGPTQMGMAH